MAQKKISILLIAFGMAFSVYAQKSGGNLFDYTVLHEIKIDFDEPDFWDILIQNYEGATNGGIAHPKMQAKNMMDFYQQLRTAAESVNENNVPFLDASITIDGKNIDEVGIRLKGFSSYFASPYYKKSIKVDINAFIDSLDYFGIKKFNLNNGVGDPSFQRDFVCYELMRRAGTAAPRTAYAKVYLNNVYWGLYLLVEQVDKTFLEDNFANGNGDLYKNIGWTYLEYTSDNFTDYSTSIELKTNEETSEGKDYIDFVKAINGINGNGFYQDIQQQLYVDYYLKILSIDIITKNWDSYISHGRNFYLYHEPVSNLIYWIPWDYNLALDGQFDNWGGSGVTDCIDTMKITYDTVGTEVSFHIDTTGIGNISQIWWDYGDNTWDNGTQSWTDPVHNYNMQGIFPARAYVSFWDGCYVEVIKRVVLMDTTGLCPSALTRLYAYYPTNDYDTVYKIDPHCCDCGWDNVCNNIFNKLSNSNSSIDDIMYPIDYFSDKPLLINLMADNRFKERYFDIFKYILDSVFIPEEIYQTIDNNVSLIREAVYADPNYIFSMDKFEYDANILCKSAYPITNVKRLIDARKKGLEVEFNSLHYSAKPLQQQINPLDVVINELSANSEDSVGKSTSDWLELYNNTDKIISLQNFGLSDSTLDRFKFVMPENTAIMPDGYFIVWADNKDKKNNVHANFKLSAAGESIFLSHKSFGLIDSVLFDKQPLNHSYARIPNGTGPFIIYGQTFNKNNSYQTAIDYPELTDGIAKYIVYPNPVTDNLTIESLTESTDYTVKIFNTNGQVVLENYSNSITTSIDVGWLPAGLYIVELIGNNASDQLKIVINR